MLRLDIPESRVGGKWLDICENVGHTIEQAIKLRRPHLR